MSELVNAASAYQATPKTRATRMLTSAGTLAACLGACGAAALAYSPGAQGQDRYKALQSVSYAFGSKFTTGYFEARAGGCLLTLMVIEKSPADEPLPVTAARIRLTLNPGQIFGLDSEEGRSLNFTCGAGAATLLVDAGERARLMELQTLSLRRTPVE
jgi:hypothetical protein